MRPILFSVHALGQTLQVHSYGIAIAIAFLAAIFLGIRQARRVGEDPELVQELCFWLLVSSMLGARLLFVLTNLPTYIEACGDAIHSGGTLDVLSACTRPLHVWEGGLVFFGGLLTAIGFAVWFTRKKHMSFRRTADVLAPSIALGHFFGRIGCWTAGCCYGSESHSWLAVRFPAESAAFQAMVSSGRLSPGADVTPLLHPVQLYEAFGELSLFFLLSWYALRKRFDGEVLLLYLALYSLLRIATEQLRGDPVRRFVLPWLSTSQALALVTLALGALLYFKWRPAPVK